MIDVTFLTNEDKDELEQKIEKGGGASSWNDLTDKPFGENADGTIHPLDPKFLPESVPYVESEVVVLLPDFQPTWDEFENDYVYQDTAIMTAGFKGGKTYPVNWNGVEYNCVAQDISEAYGSGAVALGDIYRYSYGNIGTAATGEPFCILVLVGYGAMLVVPFDGATEMTISIKGEKETIRKVDTRCLPNGYPYVEMGEMGEMGEMAEVLPVTTVAINSEGEGTITTPFSVEVGSTYVVSWNGTEYACTAFDLSSLMPGAASLGNLGAFGNADDTGEPFLMSVLPPESAAEMGAYGFVMPLDGSTEVTLSIYGRGEIIHKIDPKFLPGATIYTVVFDIDGATEAVVADKEFNEVAAMVLNPDVLVRALAKVTTNGTVVSCLSTDMVRYMAGDYIEFTAHYSSSKYQSFTMMSDGTIKHEIVDYT